jgi:MoaA/NifB/PqqE/SkfB family radical SAM enzyme
MKINSKNQNILIGSKKISTNNFFDREKYAIEYMQFNSAYLINGKDNLQQYVQKFINYRKEWKGQPKKIFDDISHSSKTKPLCVDIEVAAICDLACDFCFRETFATPDKIINDKLCFNIIDQCAELGVPSIKFNWRGEPLMNPKLIDYIKYAKKRNILDTIINTNATHLTNDLSIKLLNSGIDFVIFSFDGGTKSTYEKMRPGRFKDNLFEDVVSNIKNFCILKKKLGLKFPVTKVQMIITEQTIDEIDDFYNLFNGFVDDITVTPYSERGGNFDELSNKDKVEYNNLVNKHNLNRPAYLKTFNEPLKVSVSRKPCEQPNQRLMVTYDGRVAMCCYDWGAMHPIGYLSSDSFDDPNYDKYQVINNIKNLKKGFTLMNRVQLPPNYNDPPKKVSTLNEIWNSEEINIIRKEHINNNLNKINVCKDCSFKDTYNWTS